MKIIFIILLVAAAAAAHAGEVLTTDSVEVTATRVNLIGVAESASEGIVPGDRIANMPVLRPAEILEQTPGLIVTQHSGSGKANQYYLRGFNLDHGTDFAVWLEGMPLNMPTHGHGQGYADANIFIPELVDNVEFWKGPYFAEQGDFSSAGATRVNYYRSLSQSIASAGVGEDGYRRLLFAGSPEVASGKMLYGLELNTYDGPWDSPENLGRVNGLLRWGTGDAGRSLNVMAMFYQAHWNSTDQVPQRAIDSGQIDRWGALDDSDGGNTHRYSLSADWHGGAWQANVYAIDYKLDLHSNFTYYLDDPVNGDQFEQYDDRRVYGGALSRRWTDTLFGRTLEQGFGVQTRYDDIAKVGLYHTAAKQRLDTVRVDKVKEASAALWWQADWQVLEQVRATLGLRGDRYHFDVDSDDAANSGTTNAGIVSPKFGLAWRAMPKTELYFNWGESFHSNDARGTTIQVDPKSGDPAQQVSPLVRSKGEEIGLRAAWLPGWQTTLALFRLDMNSELLFVGDAGATEASRPSKRTGVEWTNHYRILSWLYLDADFAVSRAEFTDSDPVGDHIPGAIEQMASIGLAAERELGWYGSARLRYFGPRPLNEDNSVRSDSSTIVDTRLGYRYDKHVNIYLDALNLFDRKVSDIDYYYESQMRGEAAPVADIHTHPTESRELRLTLQYLY
ncbi:MAG TPA: TonB-dependent receptor [Methylophilaceae bacterium]|nr:TonB-dependent receptor [Methylophilaceae bacterium]